MENSNRLTKEQIAAFIGYYYSKSKNINILSFDKTKTLAFSNILDNQEEKVRCDAIAWAKHGTFDDYMRVYLIITDNRENLLSREFDVSIVQQREYDFFNEAVQELLVKDDATLFYINSFQEIYKGKYWDIVNMRFLSVIEALAIWEEEVQNVH